MDVLCALPRNRAPRQGGRFVVRQPSQAGETRSIGQHMGRRIAHLFGSSGVRPFLWSGRVIVGQAVEASLLSSADLVSLSLFCPPLVLSWSTLVRDAEPLACFLSL